MIDLNPKTVVQAFVDAFNSADVEALASLYAEDAVNHQVAEAPVNGRSAIRDMFAKEFAASKIYSRMANGRFLNGEIPWACEDADFSTLLTAKSVFREGIGTNLVS